MCRNSSRRPREKLASFRVFYSAWLSGTAPVRGSGKLSGKRSGRFLGRLKSLASTAVPLAVSVLALASPPGEGVRAGIMGMIGRSTPVVLGPVVASYLTSGSAPVGGLIVPAFEVVAPAQVGLNPKNLERAEAAVSTDVRRGLIPGAALVVGRGAEVVEKKGIGRLGSGLAEVDPDSTIYDLASLTKVVATTSAIMLLVEEGKVELDAPVQRYLPEFQGGLKNRVTVRQLLTHTSGLPAGASPPKGTPDETLKRLIATPLKTKPGERMVYSDLGPIILFAVAERVAGEAVPVMLERRVFAPLGMTSTKFGQLDACDACAPTTSGTRGLVHDPLARRLGGVAGNAGLFSTASDIGRFAAMMAGGGALGEVRIFREETVREFTARQKGAGDRALGWVTPGTRRATGSEGERISDSAFGHTGFTGTSLWIDPERGTWAVLLSNRTYIAGAPNRMQALRRTINNLVSAAVDAGS